MAWIFSIAIECGPDKAKAQAVADHFKKLDLVTLDGKKYTINCTAELLGENNYWAWITPNGISDYGVCSKKDADIMTEMAIVFYKHLKDAPEFRYAQAGVEVDDFLSYSELLDELKEYPDDFSHGLIISEEMLTIEGFSSKVFKPGYKWQPYEGESWIDQEGAYFALKENGKLKKLFDELL